MLLFTYIFSRAHISPGVHLMNQKCVSYRNLTFSEKEVFCKICSCSVNLLGKHASIFIKDEPLSYIFFTYLESVIQENNCFQEYLYFIPSTYMQNSFLLYHDIYMVSPPRKSQFPFPWKVSQIILPCSQNPFPFSKCYLTANPPMGKWGRGMPAMPERVTPDNQRYKLNH